MNAMKYSPPSWRTSAGERSRPRVLRVIAAARPTFAERLALAFRVPMTDSSDALSFAVSSTIVQLPSILLTSSAVA